MSPRTEPVGQNPDSDVVLVCAAAGLPADAPGGSGPVTEWCGKMVRKNGPENGPFSPKMVRKMVHFSRKWSIFSRKMIHFLLENGPFSPGNDPFSAENGPEMVNFPDHFF